LKIWFVTLQQFHLMVDQSKVRDKERKIKVMIQPLFLPGGTWSYRLNNA
jgi:hypothetical protein